MVMSDPTSKGANSVEAKLAKSGDIKSEKRNGAKPDGRECGAVKSTATVAAPQQGSATEEAVVDGGRYLISFSACEKISWFTQLLVLLCALAFVYTRIHSLYEPYSGKDAAIESKETIIKDIPWFRFAVCMRPSMSATWIRYAYQNYSGTLPNKLEEHDFLGYLKNLRGKSKKVHFKHDMWLDYGLSPSEYKNYFEHVHPWDNFTLNDFYGYIAESTERTDNAVTINRDRMVKTEQGKTHLKDTSRSLLYSGCLNYTILESMSKRPMEINLDFRVSYWPYRIHEKYYMFQSADLFVYHEHEMFTELPFVNKLPKYTFEPKSYHTLFVKGSKINSGKSCKNDTPSVTECRYKCIIRPFLNTVPCYLPWMSDIVSKHPNMVRKKRACQSLSDLLAVLKKQDALFKPRQCRCRPPCSSWEISMYSLGASEIQDSGIKLVVSPKVTTIKQHTKQMIIPLFGETSALISFLFGMTVIMLYDWLMFLLVWIFHRMTRVHSEWQWPWDEDQEWDEVYPEDMPRSQEDFMDYGSVYTMADEYDDDEDDDGYGNIFWHKPPPSQLRTYVNDDPELAISDLQTTDSPAVAVSSVLVEKGSSQG